MHEFAMHTVNNIFNNKISLVIVNFKTCDLVMQAVMSLLPQLTGLEHSTVYIVDNASGDGSETKLLDFIQENQLENTVKLLAMPINGGFAYGSNAGIREALANQSDFIMLLNPDTIVREGAVQALIDFLKANNEAGVAGSQLENIDGHVENSAHRFPSILGQLVESARLAVLDRLLPSRVLTFKASNTPHACDWVSGSSMMVRREVFEQVGLLDEAYFLYFEEVDFFYRANKAGWQTWYVPASRVMHMEGASTGIKLTKRRPTYWFASRRRYFIKHHGVLGLLAADAMWTIGRLSYVVRRAFKLGAQQQSKDPKWLMWDLLSGDILSVLSGQPWRLQKEKIR
jgi:N-acetylglucosaminyl-diphospho-decaprenol L-rhamnosyltransferase